MKIADINYIFLKDTQFKSNKKRTNEVFRLKNSKFVIKGKRVVLKANNINV